MAKANPRILVVGSSNMDMVLQMDRVPVAGESLMMTGSYGYVPGGKGANAAIALSRLGCGTVFCTSVGNDANGNSLISAYQGEKIDGRFIRQNKSAQTGLAVIMLEKGGQNRIAVYPGANLGLTPADAEEAFLSYPDALFMNFEISPEVIYASTGFAAKQGIPVFIDAGPTNSSLDLGRLGKVEIFSPNEQEAMDLTGVALKDTDACLQACIKLFGKVQAKYIVLKLSSRGCFVYDGKFCDFLPSYEVVAADTTAAGDAFSAALTLEYMRSHSIVRACRYANVVGALTVTRMGAMSSLPTAAEVASFMADRGIRLA